VPAELWRSFMSSALAVDRSRGPMLPVNYRRAQPEQKRLKSPLPPEWSDTTRPLRELAQELDEIFGDR
jgi:penicillin-binding protein 1A